jgi:hypothetical protein
VEWLFRSAAFGGGGSCSFRPGKVFLPSPSKDHSRAANAQGDCILFQILAYFRIRLWAKAPAHYLEAPAGLKITSPQRLSRNEKRVANYAPYGLAAPIQQRQKRFANFMLKMTE